jgi:hypothetical protein
MNSRKIRTPLHSIGKLALIAASSLVLGLVMPAFTAAKSESLFRDALISRLRTMFPDSVTQLQNFEKQKDDLKAAIAKNDNSIINAANNDAQNELSNLIRVRSELKSKLAEHGPITILPLFPHPIMYFWPIMYTCLGSLIFLLKPRYAGLTQTMTRVKLIALVTLGIYFFSTWSMWVRNFILTTPANGRDVFAYTNFDIDRFSFVMQQINWLILSLLLAVIWQQWSTSIVILRSRLSMNGENREQGYNYKELEHVSRLLLQWQASFVVLSIGFIIYTSISWDLILKDGDSRFIFEAITIHVIWAMTALLIGFPFLIAWHRWEFQKQRTIAELILGKSDGSGDLQAKLAALQVMRPFGTWNLAASGLTVISSFALPIVQALLK